MESPHPGLFLRAPPGSIWARRDQACFFLAALLRHVDEQKRAVARAGVNALPHVGHSVASTCVSVALGALSVAVSVASGLCVTLSVADLGLPVASRAWQ